MVKLFGVFAMLIFSQASYAQDVCVGGPSALPQDVRLNFVTKAKKLETCFVVPGDKAPAAKFKLLYRLVDGKLSSARFSKQAPLTPDVTACVLAMLKTWTWPRTKGKYDAAVTLQANWALTKALPPKSSKDAIGNAVATATDVVTETGTATASKTAPAAAKTTPATPPKTAIAVAKNWQATLTLSRQAPSPSLPDAFIKALAKQYKDFTLPIDLKPSKDPKAKAVVPNPFYWYLYADVAGDKEPDFAVFLKHKTKPEVWQIVMLVPSKDDGYQHHVLLTDATLKTLAPQAKLPFEGLFLGYPPCDESPNPSLYALLQDGTTITFRWARKWFETTVGNIYENAL